MTRVFFQRNVEYKVKGVNFYRTFKYSSKGYYEKGLLMIEPYQNVRMTIQSYGLNDDLDVLIEKYTDSGKIISQTEGLINRNDMLTLLGLD